MKKGIIGVLLVVILSFLISCGEKKENDEVEIIESKPEKLVVYIDGNPSHFSGEEFTGTLYPTNYTVGPRRIDGVPTASGGNIFQQALEEYEAKTGIEIEIHYLQEYGADERYTLQELYEDGKTMPDLVIASKYQPYDYYNLANKELLLDLTPYMENDESKQNEELYFQSILDAGKIDGKQYIIPLTFNLNVLITSESYLKQIGVSAQEKLYYEDIIYWLKKSCEGMQDSQGMDGIYESSGVFNGQYIMSILNAAANPSYFDTELNSVLISEKSLKCIYEVMKEYIRQEYTNLYGYEDMDYLQLQSSGQSKKRYIYHLLSGQEECIGIFLTGGRGGGTNDYHNVLTDAAYFNSYYKDKGDSMVLVGIPTCDNPDRYSANVDTMMFSFASCEHPEAIYDLMCYLMDYPFIVEAGLSVNKEITNQQLENIQNTVLTLYPDDIVWRQVVNGALTKEKALESMIEIDSLDEDNVDKIRYMLKNIEGAGLAYYPLEYLMFWRVLNEIGSNNMTTEEATEWTLDRLKERLNLFEENVAFYDEEYDYGILGWELPE